MSPRLPRPAAAEHDIARNRFSGRAARSRRDARAVAHAGGWLLLALSLLGAAAPARAAITIARTSDSHFYISNQAVTNNIRNMYVAYRITNTGPGAQSDVWVKLDTFTGGVVSLAANEDGLYRIGPLASGASAMAYLYLTASATTAVAQTHTVRVYDQRPDLPGATQLASSVQTLSDVRASLSSNANKVDVLITGPDPASLGGTVTITVQGRTGNVGVGDLCVFTAASYSNWPADQLELYSSSFTFNAIAGSNCTATVLGTFTDQLSIPASTSACYTGVYKFRVRGFTSGPTLASPILHAVSGSNYKHTDPADLAILAPISITTSATRLVKTANPTTLPAGGTSTYKLHFTNAASNASCPGSDPNCNNSNIDDVVDVLPSAPANATYVPGSAKLDGVSVADPVISGSTLTWVLGFTVTAGGTRDFTYDVSFPNTYGTYTNSAVAHVGVSQIDTTVATGDNFPGKASVQAGTFADLSLSKSGPATVNALGSITYSIVTTNGGPTAALAVVVRDTLPAGVTFVSADNGGTESGGVVTWPAVASVPNGGSITRSVTVTAPASGTLVNVARVNSSSSDPDSTNNNGAAAANRVTTTVTPRADLSLSKSGPASVDALQNLTYTLVVTNNGPSTAASVVVRDTLPAGVTFVSADNAGSLSGNVVTWPTVASIASGGSETRTVTVTAPAGGTLVNVGRADAATADPDSTNNNGSAAANRVTTTVNGIADLALSKSGPATVGAAQNLTYTLVTTNGGPSSATSVVVRDFLPAGTTFVSADNGGTEAGGVVSWPAAPSLPNGGSLTYQVTVTAPATGTLLNAARADAATTDPDSTNNNGSAPANQVSTTVVESADLSVSKSGPASIPALGSIGYTIVTTNQGPSAAASVVVRDTLPAGVTFVSATDGGTELGGVVSWPAAPSLANGASLTYGVTVTAPATGTLVNVALAEAATADPNPADNDGSAPANRVTTTVSGIADLSLSKSGPAAVDALQNLTYTIVTTNQGPSPTTQVVVRDMLPAGVTFVSADNGGTESGGVVTWPVAATLANGASLTYSVTVTAPAAGTLVNAARADAATTDPDSTNNNGASAANQVTTTVTELADLRVVKSGPAAVGSNESFTYTIVTTNHGPSAAASVTVIDSLPAGTVFDTADNGGMESGGVVTWPPVASLANGASLTYHVTLIAPLSGTMLNVARADASTADPDTTNNNGSAPENRVTTNITDLADLDLIKTGPPSVTAAGQITYTLETINHGPADAGSVVVRDTLPAGVTFVSADNGGTESGGVVTWPAIGTLGPGDDLTYSVTVTAPATGTLVNVARADAATADPDTTNNNGAAAANRVTTTVDEVADLAVSKSGPAAVTAAQTFSYTIATTNGGPSAASNVAVTDTLPAGVTFVSADNGGTELGGVVSWPVVASLANGASLTYTVTVTAPASGTLLNVARADASTADPDTTNNNGSAAANRVTTAVTESADLEVAKSGAATVTALQDLTYTILVTNHGPSTASSVVVRDTLPAGVTFVSATNGGVEAGGVVTWPAAASLANGASLSYDVTVTAPATGTLVNLARADAATADPDTTNNNGSAASNRVTTVVGEVADLGVSKTGPATVLAAQSLTYTIVTTNHGPSPASNVAVTDTLPAGVVFVSATGGGVEAGGVVTWPAAASLANGASLSYDVTVTAPATGTLVNLARADAATADPDTTNNNGSAAANRVTTTVDEIADLAVAKSGPAGVLANQTFSYTIATTNQGPSIAANVTVRDTLPAGVTFVSATGGGVEAGGVVTWPAAASLANGASLSYDVTVTAPASGVLVNIARADAATADPDTTNNNGSAASNRVQTIVGEIADLAVQKSGPASVSALGSITYTIVTTNNGPSAATSVTVVDTLPAGVTFVSATNGGVEAGGVVTWPAVASLANGASLGYDVTVTAPASGVLVNVARADAATADPDTANNNGSAAANRVITAVGAVADLRVNKSGPATVSALGSITYTIVTTNQGPSDAAAVVVRDTLPSGVTFVSATGGGVEAGGVVTWPVVVSLANGASLSYDVTVTAPASGTLVNVARADAASSDPDTTNNDGSAVANRVTTTVTEIADLSVAKSGPASVAALGSITYTIVTTNNGPSPAASVAVVDTLPAGVTFVSATNGGVEAGGVVRWPAVASLANGASLSYDVTVTAPASGTLVNVARADASTADPDTANNNGSAAANRVQTIVGEIADLAVQKSGPASVAALGSITYTIVTTNNGPSVAASVAVVDTLPAGVTFVSATNGGAEAAGVVTWPPVASLANGASLSYDVTVTAPASGVLVNVARADAATADPDTLNNNGSAAGNRVTTTVGEIADLGVVKSGPANVTPNQTFDYTIVTTNHGPSPALNVVVRDTLPANATFVSATSGGIEAGGVVTWPAATSLANGASLAYTVTVTAPVSGTLVNVARADAASSDPDTTNNDGAAAANRVTTTVNDVADLSVQKSGPASVAALGSITYTIVTTNNGPGTAGSVVVRDTLPAGTSFVSATSGGVFAGGVVTWPAFSALPNGDFLTYSVTVTAPATGTLVNVARADAATIDPDSTNNDGAAAANRVTTTVGEIADLAVQKSGPASVSALGSITYTIVTTNNGPSPATSVAVRDTLPAGVTFVSATGGGVEAGGVVSWPPAAALASGGSLSYDVTVTAPASGVLVNVARAEAATVDPDTTNNNGSAASNRVTTTVSQTADLAVAKSGPASVSALGSIAYTIVTTNNGPSPASNVAVTDTLPAGVTFVSATNGGTLAGNVVSWPVAPSLANGATLSYGVTVTAPATGTLLNVAAASAATPDPNAADNDGSAAASRVSTTVGEIADLVVTKSGPASVSALGSITYTLTAQNNGPSPATNVAISDTLPAGATFVSASGGGTLSGNVVTWPAVASLANGAGFSRTVTVTAPATGTLVNVAAGASATPDPDASNNDGSAVASRVTTSVGELADVAITKTGPAAVDALAPISYTLTVSNSGPSAAASVVVRDTLPAGVTFVSATNGGTLSGNVVTWPAIASLANGANVQNSVTVTAPTTGTLVNVAAASSATADPDPANNDGSAGASRVSTTVDAVNLVVEKTHVGPFQVGQTGLYSIVIRNLGAATAVGTITVTDTLPNGLTYASASGLNWTFTESGGVLTATHPGPIAPGGAASFTLTVFVDAAAMPSVTNSATVSNAQDPSGSRVTDVPAAVEAATALVADKRAGQGEVEIGGLLDYSISVSNQGAAVTDLVVSDRLPLGFVYLEGSARWNGIGISDPTGAPGPQLTFSPGTLANAATGVLTYRVEVGPGATLGDGINRATASSVAGSATSNTTAARVRVTGGVFAEEGVIAGKVFLDCDCSPDSLQGAEEVGVPGVRVALEDGTAAITDVEGKYHFVGVTPRLHVVRIDRATLPAGVRAVTLTNRHAEDGWSQFADLKNGELFRADFALRQTPDLMTEVLARRASGETRDPVSLDQAMGVASVRGPAITGVRATGYRGLLEERGWSSAARSLPLAGDVPGLHPLTPPSSTSPGSPSGLPASQATGVGARVARPSLLALGLLETRLELRGKKDDALFTRRDRFEDELSDFSIHKDDGRFSAAGRGALFLTGPVAQDYRLTLRYDSERDTRTRFFRDIRPDEFYPIYGDASVPEFFAQSRNRLYAKVERERSFLEYGDFSTATANPLRALGRFDRTLNGGLGHVEWSHGAVEAFGSRGMSRQVVDELPALGISGPYALSRPEGLTNSERVEIITRDRDRPAVIVDRQVMQRFVDYTIEPFSGRIVFRRAVPSVDENLNPVSIRVSYEADGGVNPFWVYGAEARVRPVQALELGANATREEDPALGNRTIASANAALEVLRGVTVLGEFAHSDSAGAEGNAARAELRASQGPFDLNAFAMRTGDGFSNPSSGFTRGRNEFSANGGWKLDDKTRLFGEAIYSRDRIGGGRRAGGTAGLTRKLSDRIIAELAYRGAKESTTPASAGTAATPGASPNETRSLRARLTGQLTPKASVFGEYEQDLQETDQRRAAVGGDLQLLARTRGYLRYEFLSSFAGPYALNDKQERYALVAGLASEDTRAGTLFSEYRLRDAIDGRSAQAAIGLRNRWTLHEGLHLDASAERVSPVKGGGASQTAAGFGLEYTQPSVWRATGRVEWRRGAGDDQMFGSLGYAHKLARDWAVLGNGWADMEDRNRVHARTQFGVAWRQTEENKWNGLARLDSRYDRDLDAGGASTRTAIQIVSAHASYQPGRPYQLRGEAATRFTDALDTKAGSINASLLALRATWDMTRVLDTGVIGRTLFTDHLHRRQDGLGAEIGLTPLKNFRLATGYNWFGYADGDLTGGSRSDTGFYVDFGLKLDEDVFRWLNPERPAPGGKR